MKLTVSLTYYSPYISGLTLYAKRLAEALAKEKIDISVLTMKYDRNLQDFEVLHGVKVLRAKVIKGVSKGFLSWDWLVQSAKLAAKTDCLIINLPQAEGIIPAIFFKLFGRKIISVYHCEVILPSGTVNKIIQILLNFSNFLSLMLSDTVITYTKDFAVNSRLLLPFQKKIKTVYPPVISPKIDNRVKKEITLKILHSSRLNRDSRDKQPYLIGLAARLAAEKGVEYLLTAIPILKRKLGSEFKIVFAGSLNPVGEEKYKNKILKLVKKYKDEVIFLGEIKEEAMGSFYSLLDILVLPSVNSTEAFGMVQVEAMMMGVPVVASNLPGVRIPIRETGMGQTVALRDSSALAEAIIKVLHNKKEYFRGKEKALNLFKMENTVDFYLQLLRN